MSGCICPKCQADPHHIECECEECSDLDGFELELEKVSPFAAEHIDEPVTISLKPTAQGYARSIELLLFKGDSVGKAWARAELLRLCQHAYGEEITPNTVDLNAPLEEEKG